MSLLWKLVAVLAIVLAVELQMSEAIKHIHKSDRARHHREELEAMGDEVTIHGKIYCQGKPYAYSRPYISSLEYGNHMISMGMTNEQGWYRLHFGPGMDFHKPVDFILRHQCPVERLAPMKKCAVAHYTLRFKMDVTNHTYINQDIELSTQTANTSADCLY